jgi:hypothetical protein
MIDSKKPKLLDQVRQVIWVKHYSSRNEESYINWIKRFIFFHNKKHPIKMGEKEIGEFIISWEQVFIAPKDWNPWLIENIKLAHNVQRPLKDLIKNLDLSPILL